MRSLKLIILFAILPYIVAQNHNRFNISGILGWFARPPPPPKPDDIENLATKNEFNNPLPSDGINKLINDVLIQRLSKETEGVAQSEALILNANQHNFIRSIPEPNNAGHLPLLEALRIVNTSNLTDCVARVICELSCNSNLFGNQGRIVFKNLIKIQLDKTVKSEDAKVFRQAAIKGRQLISSKKDCNECHVIYPSCKSSSKDLVAVSALFKF